MRVTKLSSLLRLVGDEKRLKMLVVLADGGKHCVCEFESHLPDVSQSLMSHHLADLRAAGLVRSERQGLRAYYTLTPQGEAIVRTVCGLIQEGEDGMNNCPCGCQCNK